MLAAISMHTITTCMLAVAAATKLVFFCFVHVHFAFLYILRYYACCRFTWTLGAKSVTRRGKDCGGVDAGGFAPPAMSWGVILRKLGKRMCKTCILEHFDCEKTFFTCPFLLLMLCFVTHLLGPTFRISLQLQMTRLLLTSVTTKMSFCDWCCMCCSGQSSLS